MCQPCPECLLSPPLTISTASAPAATTTSPTGLPAPLWPLHVNRSTSCCSQVIFLHLILAKRVKSDKPGHLPKLFIRMNPFPTKKDNPEVDPTATMMHLNSISQSIRPFMIWPCSPLLPLPLLPTLSMLQPCWLSVP